ncbi:hypothetical protein QN277_000990 [Acacia crassicarpa]|uniref:RNase H type-1 domain-containing protein n=1 Tax=Acacia crassicarpa TaxID=499986 RepID=A0AAE1TG91_9FABA|nr:hypothetical protein QN277_000990 [Acacia crassicarpa]
MNLKGKLSKDVGVNWNIMFGVAIWRLWGWRNSSIFDSNFSKPPCPAAIILHSWRKFAILFDLNQDVPNVGLAIEGELIWERPPMNWVKLNVDGAVSRRSSLAGVGELLRGWKGEWIAGFTKSVGICNANSAEEWAIWEGLNLAWDLGFKKIVLESDAQELVLRLLDRNFNSGSFLAVQIQDLMLRDWSISPRHIPRECNRIADALAKLGLLKSCVLSDCPLYLRAWVDQEALGLISPMF